MKSKRCFYLLEHILLLNNDKGFFSALIFMSQLQLFAYLIILTFEYSHFQLYLSLEYLRNGAQIFLLDTHGIFHPITEFILMIVFIYIGTLFLLSLYVVYLALHKKNSTDWFFRFFRQFAFFYVNFGYAPCNFVLVRHIQDFIDGKMLIFNSVNSPGFLSITVLITFFNFLTGTFMALFSFQPNITLGPFSRRYSITDLFNILSKSSMLLGLIVDYKQGFMPKIAIFLPIIFMLLNLSIMAFDSPYYHPKYSVKIGVMIACNLSMGLTSLFSCFFNSHETISDLLIFSTMFGVISMSFLYITSKRNKKRVGNIFRAETVSDAFSNLGILLDILRHKNVFEENLAREETIYYNAMIRQHHMECGEKNCYCRYFYQEEGEFLLNSNKLENLKEEFNNDQLRNFFENVLKSGVDDPWLKIAYSNLVIKNKLEHYPLALSILHSIQKYKLDSLTQFLTEFNSSSISKFVNLIMYQQEECVDMVKFTKYKAGINQIKAGISEVTKITKSFWEIYKQYDPRILHMYNKSTTLANMDDELRKIWRNMKEKYGTLLLEDHIFYAAYNSIIRNFNAFCFDLLKSYDFQKLRMVKSLFDSEDITDLTINQSKNLAISLNLNKKQLGNILDCFGKIQDLLGWKPKELKGRNINSIIPPYIRSHHDSFLRNHVNSGRISLLYKNRLVYGQHKNGYIVPLKVYVTPSIHLDKELSYLGMIRPIKQTEDCIILGHDGKILSCTQNIGAALNIHPENTTGLNISDFCKMFYKLNKVFNTASYLVENRKELQDSADPEDLNFVKAKKVLVQFSQKARHHFEHMVYPSSEEEFANILKMYRRLKVEGWALEFTLKNGSLQTFTCRAREDTNFKKENVKFLNLRPFGNKAGFFNSIQTVTKNNYTLKVVSTVGDLRSEKGTKLLSPKNVWNDVNYVNQKLIIDNGVSQMSNENTFIHEASSRNDLAELGEKFEKEKNLHAEIESISCDQDNDDRGLQNNIEDKYLDLIYYRKKRIDGNLADESSINSSTSYSANATLTEKNLYNRPRESFLKFIICCMTLYYLSGALIFLIFNFYVNDAVTQTTYDSRLIDLSLKTNNHLLYAEFETRLQWLSYNGLISTRPYSLALEEEYVKHMEKILYEIENNNLQWIKLLANSGSTDFRRNEELVILYLRGEEGQSNLVSYGEAVLDMLYSILEIVQNGFPSSRIDTENLMKNIPNDIVKHSIDAPEFIHQILKKEIQKVSLLIESILTGTGIMTFFIILLNIRIEYTFLSRKVRFFDGYLKMNQYSLEDYLERVQRFSNIYKEMLAIEKNEEFELVATQAKSKDISNLKQKDGNKSKKMNLKGVFVPSIIRFVIKILTLFSILIGTAIIRSYLTPIDEDFLFYNKALISNYKYLNSFLIYIIANYDYIGLMGSSSLRNNNISSEIQNDVNFVKKYTMYFTYFDNPQEIRNKFGDIFESNLCSIIYSNVTEFLNCENLASGVARFGLGGINAQLVTTLEASRNEFDLMVKSQSSVGFVLKSQNLRDLEKIILELYRIPFEMIQTRLLDMIMQTRDDYVNILWSSNVSIIVLGLLLALIAVKLIYTHAYNERYYLQRMLQMMPLPAIIENAHLKAYLPHIN